MPYVLSFIVFIFLSMMNTWCFAINSLPSAATQPIPINQISGFEKYPAIVKDLINKAANLTQLNLTYLYGSADPKNQGMDCSGSIYYLLTKMQVSNVPRQSDELFDWVKRDGKLHLTKDNSLNSVEFSQLNPGDLLFWSGTYETHRKSPITHVMLYLGKDKEGRPMMFGASNGRTYNGKKMNGVSVFDFNLPKEGLTQQFVGYSCIPKLTCN